MNRLAWDLRYPGAESFPSMIIWGSLQGPRATPGTYQAVLKVGEVSRKMTFEVKPDPRISTTMDDLAAQLRFLLESRDTLTLAHNTIKQIRDIREQMTNIGRRLKDRDDVTDVRDAAKGIETKLTSIEETLYQTKSKSSQDVLNYPIRLNNKLASLAGMVGAGDNRPTDQAMQVKSELTSAIDVEIGKFRDVVEKDLRQFNELLLRKKVPAIFAEPGNPNRK
jgi:hypothetical protein